MLGGIYSLYKFESMRQLIAILLIVTAGTAMAAPTNNLAQHWQPHNADSTATIDHSALTSFLEKYVVKQDGAPNMVRYGDITQADHKALQAYLASLTRVPLAKYNRNEQLAYWINLYNAALLNLVINHYPIKSVRDIDNPWNLTVVRIDGINLSLNAIRNRILWPLWHYPILYYGLSWAAIGGPELHDKAYVGDGIYQQLTANARRFIASPQGLTTQDNRLIISKFFEWNSHAFGRTATALISQLREHAKPALSARLDVFHDIAGVRFDWRLNDAGKADASKDDSTQ